MDLIRKILPQVSAKEMLKPTEVETKADLRQQITHLIEELREIRLQINEIKELFLQMQYRKNSLNQRDP